MAEDISHHDGRRRRCPMLGHDVPFAYCRAPGSEIPCRRVFDCWWETFEVEAFVRAHYREADVAKTLAPRQDKADTIVELIERARKAAEKKT